MKGGLVAAQTEPALKLQQFLFVLVLCMVGGCYTTTVRIETEPPGATVHYDFEPKGVTPVEFPVEWYGIHKVTLDHPDYGRRVELIDLDAPAHLTYPVDLFATLAPWHITDRHEFHFDLTQAPESESSIQE